MRFLILLSNFTRFVNFCFMCATSGVPQTRELGGCGQSHRAPVQKLCIRYQNLNAITCPFDKSDLDTNAGTKY
ncbi:hypothetical protein PR003_g14432 [Phytophthora rubi]|uniref:Secreted protein n=1 Tax=Phytophthora rubi TaxID=129364 RepID=A0A6A3LIV0_9STRA|nr:hypothetical protein PR002_g13846 [Phytophthora rubi]KAE9332592.1 hypothetical protein PR003_g14432 [Phytophthora rubi]